MPISMKNQGAVIGLDIGGTKISAGIFKQNGELVSRKIKHLNNLKGSQVVNLAGELVADLSEEADRQGCKVKALGVCVPGIYHPQKKTVWAPNIDGWEDFPLYTQITNIVNDVSLPIVIDSDRSCYILGECWQGVAKGCTDAIFMSIGTGIGAGIISGGHLLNGHSGVAGAVGWLALEPPYDTKYDPYGNFEYYASGNGLARSALEALNEHKEYDGILASIPATHLSSQDVFRALEQNDKVAKIVIEKAIEYWGMTIANLVSIFNPQKVILGGGVFGPGVRLIEKIWDQAQKWAQPISFKEVELVESALKGDAGLYGAGYQAIRALSNNQHGSN